MLSEQLGASPALYQTQWMSTGYLSAVETVMPLSCHHGCTIGMQVNGSAMPDVSSSAEDAADRLLHMMRANHGVRVHDLNWSPVARSRRRLLMHRSTSSKNNLKYVV